MVVSRTKRTVEHSADRRVRELYRYYQPAGPSGLIPSWLPTVENLHSSVSSGTPSTPVTGDGSTNGSGSVSSRSSTAVGPEALVLGVSNNTLTSFAQLAALRLNVERAFICVLDRDRQYILADSTKTDNLNSKSVHDQKDNLSVGSTASRKAWSLCQETSALPASDRETPHYEYLSINDLSENERYKRLPFVENEPHFRFYAGTPLTTDNNINLGCLFVLDKNPRDGLTPIERDTLGSLSMLVMDYLKVCRQASEGRRAARLSRGLSCFVEGSSSFVDSIVPSRAGSCPPYSVTPPPTHNRISMSGGSRESQSVGQVSQEESQGSPKDRSLSNDARSMDSGVSGASDSKNDVGTSGAASSLPEWLTSSSRNHLPPDDSHGNSWCFRRAANLLRESLDLSNDGGVIFLEATNSPYMDNDSGSDCSGNHAGGPATILSMSTYDEPFSPRAGSVTTSPAANLDRSFLNLLLRRYPRGKLWSFHRDGLISTSDDDDQKPRDKGSSASGRSPPRAPPVDATRPLGKRRKAAENSLLNQYFPGATQIMFVPLWNAVSSQWFAGCFCYTTLETQVFSTSVELSSVLGFGSSVMAEYSRVESLIADRQKGDFIGSISHELRSPLHGILAAAEFLNGTNLNEFQDSLLETVNACGRTLLDTMNQVLDFSKVVSLERTWRSLKRNKESPLDFKGTDKLASHLDSYVVTDLAILAEEVIEGICLGHTYGQNSYASADLPVLLSHNHTKHLGPSSNVDVVIDVQHRDWIYRTQPGALRRIIMNVFGNAMKYTDQGRVTLSLEAESHSEGRTRRQGLEDMVTLTVSDTGRGISEEFMRGKLYTPFAQEDSLAVGTGLGLSIVRSLVKALNGNIRIHSRPGEGTVVRVRLPLARPVGEESPPVEPHAHNVQQRDLLAQNLLLRDGYAGKRAAIWGVNPENVTQNQTWGEIARYLTEWFGIEVVEWPSPMPLDVLLVQEADLEHLRTAGLSATLPSLLILCSKSVDYSMALSEWLPLASSVDLIRRPCGPHKLARSVLKSFQNCGSAVVTPMSMFKDPRDLPIRTPPMTSMATSPVTSSHLNPLVPTSSPKEIVGTGRRSLENPSPEQALSIISGSPNTILAAPLPPPLVDGAIESKRPTRILVVDDNRINLNLMMTFMKKRNLTELVSAENGKLAVEAAERMQSGFDIIFMDMSMPVMNGFEATRAIRSLERDSESRRPAIIIALTGLSSSRDESEALASGVDLFLTKPVSFREVSRLLDEWERDGLTGERNTP
ncbi:uncharacterized protein N7482_009687 [Penicillium canariense]|uniref:histidine kinase n=1 Tax=Penicillium canariense TaxID=189055 RepID=A0A9W9HTQ2_9EURO|nr:uncharacterized protein N7482_009687 [Penicillium canariense]KAJ5153209.1 hypothetical protein N7482_009687 [Penicillium canariense]